MPIDLDAMQAYLTGEATNGLGQPLGISVTLALVAELRAAREVVKATGAIDTADGRDILDAKVTAYRRVVAG
jgi:hypothetical protein